MIGGICNNESELFKKTVDIVRDFVIDLQETEVLLDFKDQVDRYVSLEKQIIEEENVGNN